MRPEFDRLGDELRATLESMAREMPASVSLSPGLHRRARRRVLRTGIVLVVLGLAASLAAFGSARALMSAHSVPAVKPTPTGAIHLPQAIGGARPTVVQPGYVAGYRRDQIRGLTKLPTVSAAYGMYPSSQYNITLVDVPLSSPRVARRYLFGSRVHTIQQAFPRLFNGCLSIFTGCSMSGGGSGVEVKHAVFLTSGGVDYGCAPVVQATGFYGNGKLKVFAMECMWAAPGDFAVVDIRFAKHRPIDVFAALRLTLMVYRDTTSGPAGPCSFPTCARGPVHRYP